MSGGGEQTRAPEASGEEQSRGGRGSEGRVTGQTGRGAGGGTDPTAQGFSQARSDWDKILWGWGRGEMSLVIGSS